MSDHPEGFEKKTFQISSKKFVSLKKLLTFAAAIETIAKKFFENITYQQVVQETYIKYETYRQ